MVAAGLLAAAAPAVGAAPPAAASTAAGLLYVTFSGEGGKGGVTDPITQVRAFRLDGAPASAAVLAVPGSITLSELRGMAFGPDGTLYVANAHKTDSMVLAFGPAGADGTRAMLGTAAWSTPTSGKDGNAGLDHPYGLAWDAERDGLLVTSQDTFVGTWLKPDGSPHATAAWITAEPTKVPFFPGTFAPGDVADAKLPEPVSSSKGGLRAPRGVAYDAGLDRIFVADSTDGAVKAYDGSTGAFLGKLLDSAQLVPPGGGKDTCAPVGVIVAGTTAYVSCEGTDDVWSVPAAAPPGKDGTTGGPITEVVPRTMTSGGATVTLDHPSGLALGADGALYVNSRVGLAINRYVLGGGVATTASVVVPSCAAAPTLAPPACLTDQPEQLLAVPHDPTATPSSSTTTTTARSSTPVVTPAFTG